MQHSGTLPTECCRRRPDQKPKRFWWWCCTERIPHRPLRITRHAARHCARHSWHGCDVQYKKKRETPEMFTRWHGIIIIDVSSGTQHTRARRHWATRKTQKEPQYLTRPPKSIQMYSAWMEPFCLSWKYLERAGLLEICFAIAVERITQKKKSDINGKHRFRAQKSEGNGSV